MGGRLPWFYRSVRFDLFSFRKVLEYYRCAYRMMIFLPTFIYLIFNVAIDNTTQIMVMIQNRTAILLS